MLPRVQLLELEDQPWFPALLRDYMTDLLNAHVSGLGLYDSVVPLLHRALQATGDTELLDLCSGGGGPIRRIASMLRQRHELRIRARLSDKFPNRAAFERAVAESPDALSFIAEPIDAAAVPEDLPGFRTLFTSFHHFPPETAAKILADAVKQKRGIGIFEFTERSLLGLSSMAFSPLLTLAATPFLRPRRVSRFLLTYALPVVPMSYFIDGVLSQLRSYSVAELRQLAAAVDAPAYRWEAGQTRHRILPMRITYLLGYPST